MTQKLFGTDGIRGVANRHPMTPEVALQLGKAIARTFGNGKPPQVVIGKDTRRSGYLFESALTAGLCAGGATVFLVGPLPTPAVAHITRSFGADVGIMITASHNPAADNGMKLFGSDGFKLPDEQEAAIEAQIIENLNKSGEGAANIGKAIRIDDARGRYIEFAKSTIKSSSLKGLKIVLDCANGAAYSIAPVIFKELGAEVITLNNKPDGENINLECGALHPEVAAAAVKEHGADVGITLDGDADRLILIDENGTILTGDHIMAMSALFLDRKERLAGKRIIATEYSNKGLDECLANAGITVERVLNGDRQVIEAMRKKGVALGGEQSGHIIFMEYVTTGDGTIAGLQLLRMMKEERKPLSEMARVFCPWPQRVEAFTVKEKKPLEKLTKVQEAIIAAQKELGNDGRVLVRYSGTEPKVRVMIESKAPGIIETLMQSIKNSFKEERLLTE